MSIDTLVPQVTFRPNPAADAARTPAGAVAEVIDIDGLPVGHLLVAPIAGMPGGLNVVDLVVRREHRRRGAGTAALLRWAEVAHAAGGPLTVTIPADDPHVGFYRRLGFRMVRAVGSPRARLILDPGGSW